MKKLLLILMLYPLGVFAQLSGTYSIPGDYPTIWDANEALQNNGVSAPVIFEIAPGTYYGVDFQGFPGSDSLNSVTFKHNGMPGEVEVIPPNINSPTLFAIVEINYVQNIILDGLTFIQKNTDFYSVRIGIMLNGCLRDVTIQNCKFVFPEDFYGTGIQQLIVGCGEHFNFYNNEFYNVDSGIINVLATNIRITGNEIHNSSRLGFTLFPQDSLIVSNNKIKLENLSVNGNIGIIAHSGINIEIFNNEILSQGGDSFRGIFVGSPNGININGQSKIYNNIVSSNKNTKEATGICILNQLGNVDIFNNSISINSQFNFFETTGLKIENSNVRIKNNNVINRIESPQSYTLVCDSVSLPNLVSDCDFNNFFSKGSNLIKSDSLIFSDLNQWNSATGFDANSISKFPGFVSETDLHINENEFSPINNQGTPIPYIFSDIDGENRDIANPDIGADEFASLPYTNDVGFFGKVEFDLATVGLGNQTKISVNLKNFTNNQESFVVSAFLQNDISKSKFASNSVFLSGNDSTKLDFNFKTNYIDRHKLTFEISDNFDVWSYNDTLSTTIEILGHQLTPFVDDFSFFDKSKWTHSSFQFTDSFIKTLKFDAPSPPFTLVFNAQPTKNDTLTSAFIDLPEYPNSIISFYYQQFYGSSLSFGVEYLNANGAWNKIPELQFIGNSTGIRDWKKVEANIPNDVANQKFKIRFVSNVPTGSGFIYIDDLFIGQKSDGKPTISFIQIQDKNYSDKPFFLSSKITDNGTLVDVSLNWKISTNPNFDSIQMTKAQGNFYEALIPSQPIGTTIEYFIQAQDDNFNISTNPINAPQNVNFFTVGDSLAPQNLSAISFVDKAIPLYWDLPNFEQQNPLQFYKNGEFLSIFGNLEAKENSAAKVRGQKNNFNSQKQKKAKTYLNANFFTDKMKFATKKNQNQISSLSLNSFRIYRSQNSSILKSPTANLLIHETTFADTLSFIDTDANLQNGKIYFYIITATYLDSLGNLVESFPSNIAIAKPLETLTPSNPMNLQKSANGAFVTLNWTNPTTNTDSTILGDLAFTRIYRKDLAVENSRFTLLDSVSFGAQSFSDFNPLGAAEYFVSAVDTSGNESSESNSVFTLNLGSFGQEIIFSDSLENNSNWEFANSDSLVGWAIDSTPDSVLGTQIPHSGNYCLNYNNGIDFVNLSPPNTINSGNNGTATLFLNLDGFENVKCVFWSLYETEELVNFDRKYFEVSTDTFKTVVNSVKFYTDPQGIWVPKVISLDSTLTNIQVRFNFDTYDGLYNDFAGWFIDNFSVIGTTITTSIKNDIPQIPADFTLSQNYPNPFNPTTKIKFSIPEKAFTKLEIFNVLGQSVRTLVSEELQPNFYEFQWNGTNGSGKSVSSGVYFYRLEAGNFVETRKMLFLK